MKTLLALLLSLTEALPAAWDKHTQGDCSPIISGDLNHSRVAIHGPGNKQPATRRAEETRSAADRTAPHRAQPERLHRASETADR